MREDIIEFTQSDLDRIYAARANGATWNAVGALFNITGQSLRNRLSRRGIQANKREIAQSIFDIIEDAAERGDHMPTNSVIAEMSDIHMRTVVWTISNLNKEGRITIEAGPGTRRACVNGKWTKWTARADSRAAREKTGWAMRTCMCCRRQFSSEGIGNRLCWSCKHQNEGAMV